MTNDGEFKQIVRERMDVTGENYTTAMRAVLEVARHYAVPEQPLLPRILADYAETAAGLDSLTHLGRPRQSNLSYVYECQLEVGKEAEEYGITLDQAAWLGSIETGSLLQEYIKAEGEEMATIPVCREFVAKHYTPWGIENEEIGRARVRAEERNRSELASFLSAVGSHADLEPETDLMELATDMYKQAHLEYGSGVDAYGWPYGLPYPSNDSGLVKHEGQKYVVFRNVNGVLAVYIIGPDDSLTELEEWPEELEEY